MKRRICIFFFLFTFFVLTPAYPYWIWTPKTRKWVNPKTMVKTTPKEQFEFARSYYNLKNYDQAQREFKKLLKTYPKSYEAAESQYYLGLINEARQDLYAAFQEYQKVIDKYPFSERIPEIIEHQYKIGEAFMSGEKRKGLGITLPVENPAIEIFAKVVENSSYGPLAPAAEYKLGLVLKGLLRYYEAEEAFSKVISNYPDSEWVAAAQYQLASCRAAVSRGPAYDQAASEEAKEKFEVFLSQHPEASLSKEAEKNIEQLKNKEAEANYYIACFYEKQKNFSSARIYYQDILENAPDTVWAVKANQRLQALEKEKK